MTPDYDVLVVGGGPAGLATAERCAAAGRVMLVHRDAEIGRPVRTSGGSWKAHLVALGIPARCFQEIDELLVAGPDRRIEVAFDEDRPVVLDVTATYLYLAELARAAGARLECAATFLGLAQESDGILACRVRVGGVEQTVTSRYVVEASGHHRAVLTHCGAGARPDRVGVGVEAEFENAGTAPARAVLFVGNEFCPSGYGWIFPTTAGTVRVGVGIIRPDTKKSAGDLLDAFLASPSAAELGLQVGRLVEKHFGVIPSDGTPPVFVHGNIVAVGDAAGQALPLVGEGIRYSVECGRKVGEVIAAALAHPATASAELEKYPRWWNAKYRSRFALAQRANVKMGKFSDRRWHEALGLLAKLSGREVASLLRMDFNRWLAVKLALRGGFRGARYFRECRGREARPPAPVRLMKPIAILAVLLGLAGGLSSCATHRCAKMDGRQDPKNFVFRDFKTKAHVYPVAVTRPAGAPILVLHGLGGLDGATLDWGQALSQHGWKVYLPMLDGEFDRCDPLTHSFRMRKSGVWQTDDPHASGQVLDDMGALADEISARHGGRRIVAVGNCLTGSFPLALIARPSVKTAVLCQPALPLKSPLEVLLRLPQSPAKRKALAMPAEQLDRSMAALHDPSKRLYGFHYLEDPLASFDKFVTLHDKLEEHGLAWKFRPIVLEPVTAPPRQTWWRRMNTNFKQGRITPHVTVTGGEEVDRTPLRKLFDQMVQP